ncbi:MAG: type II secretion system F family protein [Planctomycetia bacterium]|nr:type II secretion system F family protein [Planctomycetia bacterium]
MAAARNTLAQTAPAGRQMPALDLSAPGLVAPGQADAASQTQAEQPGDLALFSRGVRRRDIVYMTNQLSIMLETGIPLATALTAIIDQERTPSVRKLLAELRESVESGDDFSTALSKHKRHFDRTYISLVRASEATGTLAEMLDRVSRYLQKQLETQSKVRAAMAYPALMGVMALSVTIFLLTYILPKFTPIFANRGVQLPKPTRFLMALSDVLVHYWYFWLGGAIVVVLAAVLGKRTDPGREFWDRVKINLPVIGPALRKVILSRTIRTLGVMVQGGVSIIDAIQLAADVSTNCHYERSWRNVLEQVTAGNEIHVALRENPLFPPTLVQMIAAGEQTGKLDVVLQRVSEYYDQEVEASLKTATSLLEPLLIAFMGVVVGGIGLALLLPIFSLSRAPG